MQAAKIRIGTRGSPLALAQAHEVRRRLAEAHGLAEDACELVIIKTTGDRITDRPLADAGGKGLFTKEIEEALLAGEIDARRAFHEGHADVAARWPRHRRDLPREDPRDAFVSVKFGAFDELPAGARVGTSSPRRQAQLLHRRPDLKVVPLRGNVETRLRKLDEGVGGRDVSRLRRAEPVGSRPAHHESASNTDVMLPAVAQGAIGIEIRAGDADTARLIAPLNDAATALCVAAERAFLAQLDGSCRTPIAGLAQLSGTTLTMRGEILTPDGKRRFAAQRAGEAQAALRLGEEVAAELLGHAGPDFLLART